MKRLIFIALALFISTCDAYPPTEVGNSAGAYYYNRGLEYQRKGQYDKAISDYSKAIEINPRDAEACYNRGNAYQINGQYDQAISDYNKAIEINPRYAKAYNNRGYAYYEKGEYDRACSDYQKACELGVCKGLNWAKESGYCR